MQLNWYELVGLLLMMIGCPNAVFFFVSIENKQYFLSVYFLISFLIIFLCIFLMAFNCPKPKL